ncbi:MAG TPA: TIGR00730 family Rossman fold protein [Ktedonobacterales bacterium]|nr:TIGR00730 family Rossman fold protein [Ktedonobacterales bacterium]
MSLPPENSPAPNGSDIEHEHSWRIFRIMSEFVEGFTFLAHFERTVTFFGSARLPESSPYYQQARELGRLLAERGHTIVTGGGPGIMQAGNQGAYDAKGNSVGLNIQLPMEQRTNPYVRQSMSFHYFFSRKVMLDFSAEAYIFFPGGFGTLDEFFEVVTLAQTGKIKHGEPIILVGRDFWQPLVDWLESVLLNRLHTIAPKDLRIWTLTDDLNEVVRLLEESARKQVEQRMAVMGRTSHTPNDMLKQATQPMTELEQ